MLRSVSCSTANTYFYGISRGKNLLAPFIQWVHIPAVKDAADEQSEGKSTAIGQLLARTVRVNTDFSLQLDEIRDQTYQAYGQLLEEHQAALTDITGRLQRRLAEWAHPNATLEVAWSGDPEKSVSVKDPIAKIAVGEDGFQGEVGRLGHGLQRSFLIALLQELAVTGSEAEPRLLLSVEEPELFQHPPQAKHLASVLKKLSGENAQVMICTHSPYFVSARDLKMCGLLESSLSRTNRAWRTRPTRH